LTFARAIAAVCISYLCAISAARADQSSCFRVFDATLYVDKPDLADRGIQTANVFEPDRWWPKGPHNDDLPDASAAQEWVRRIRMKHGLLVLDLERWWLRGDDAPVLERMRRYVTVFDWIRRAGYSDPMGYYGAVPTYNPEGFMEAEGSPKRAQWRKENDRIQPLADRVDILFPSLYTDDEDIGKWQKRADATLQEARRLAHGKPVYPFLWPQYAGTNRPFSLMYMPASQWTRELEVVSRNADGVVIWGGIALPGSKAAPKWDEASPWWQSTLEFLAHQHVCSPGQ
jgi:hypothetical protein